jgi:hypothetical protein
MNEYDAVAFAVRWVIENKATDHLDRTDHYLIEKIIDDCHSALRKKEMQDENQ